MRRKKSNLEVQSTKGLNLEERHTREGHEEEGTGSLGCCVDDANGRNMLFLHVGQSRELEERKERSHLDDGTVTWSTKLLWPCVEAMQACGGKEEPTLA